MTVTFNDLWRKTWTKDKPALALVFGATNTTPVRAAILAEQIVIDDYQGATALTVDVLEV